MDGLEILNRIIHKGGIMGACAKMYINDEEKASQFVTECLKQCHNETAKKLWGVELISEIERYCSKTKNHLFAEEPINQ